MIYFDFIKFNYIENHKKYSFRAGGGRLKYSAVFQP